MIHTHAIRPSARNGQRISGETVRTLPSATLGGFACWRRLTKTNDMPTANAAPATYATSGSGASYFSLIVCADAVAGKAASAAAKPIARITRARSVLTVGDYSARLRIAERFAKSRWRCFPPFPRLRHAHRRRMRPELHRWLRSHK